MNSQYLKQLNDMYDGFYCCNGQCKCLNDCKNGNEPTKFFSDRVQVGKYYGEKYPKVLFVGLESVYDGPGYCIPQLSEESVQSVPSLDAWNVHYRGVRYVLSYILSEFDKTQKPQSAKKDDLKKYENHLQFYSLTNIYKCAFSNKRSGLPHSKSMEEHCPDILFNEIEILHPDIVVIQAKSSVPQKLWKGLCDKYGKERPERLDHNAQNAHTSCYKMFYQNGEPFCVIWTYHGNGFPRADFPRAEKSRGIFVNNDKYIQEILNPVLDKAIEMCKEKLDLQNSLADE